MNKTALAMATCCALLAGGAAAQTSAPVTVSFGVGENAKTQQLSRHEINGRAAVTATASTFPAERVCNLPDNRTALQSFITEYSSFDADTVRYEVGRLLEDANDESTMRPLTSVRNKFGRDAGTSQARIFTRNGVAVAVSGNQWSDLNAGKSVASVVERRCLAVEEARAWLREAARILGLYYGFMPGQ